MRLAGKFKTEFEKWFIGKEYLDFDDLPEPDKGFWVREFIRELKLDPSDVQKSIKTFNEYFDNI